MDFKDTVNAIKNVDNTLRYIVPITEHVVNKVRRNTGGWGFDAMLMTPISDYCLVDMGDWQMRKAMFLNMAEKDITLDLIADSVTGISNKVSDESYKYDYSYAQENNYLNNYQREAKYTTTREGRTDNNIQNYVNHNELYGQSVNVYPDDDNTGTAKFTEDRKWNFYDANRNRNSIIYKTKKLFNERKINTIISRFHTDPDKLDLYDDTEAKSVYGLSHGRNLLTYDAERNGISYDRNGYDNPYCRVWTHHHQYSEVRARLIRPFTIEDENGNIEHVKNSDIHNWGGFTDVNYKKWDKEYHDKDGKVIDPNVKWGWKDSGKDGWDMSVLDKETGLVNIAPKFLGGAEKNIHTKDCMFSIENLAWQGYDPYSFERALSWEQRGPFGGRIMWFPPYGLRFSEDTSVNWNEHSFIGRGENVFTYTNTSRSGTLEFMMVVDHPSITDYATWYGKSQPDQLPKDTDVLRFFAGCGVGKDGVSSGESDGSGSNGGGGSLLSFVKPTPLTDEYLKKDVSPQAVKVTENKKPEPPTPPQPEVPAPDEEIELTFYVFYPNNYSGYYDNNESSKVNPIAYLLYGKGAQWKCNDSDVTKSEVLPLDFEDTSDDSFVGNGYEMLNSKSDVGSQNSSHNYIIGTGYPGSYGKTKYIPTNSKKWYYRIDGEYVPNINYSSVKNTFGQKLRNENSYQDMKTLQLNCNVENVKKKFPEEKDNKRLYSLAEIAYALKHNYENENSSETADQVRIKRNSGSLNEDRIKELVEMFDTRDSSPYKVIEVHGIGFSNSHGTNSKRDTNTQRNQFLAEQRCKTAIRWFITNYGHGSTTINTGSELSEYSVKVSKEDLQNESGDTAKMYRSAKMKIKIKKSAVLKPKEMNQESETSQEQQETQPYKRFDDFKEVEKTEDGIQLYEAVNQNDIQKKGIKWYYDEKTQEMKVWNPEIVTLGRWDEFNPDKKEYGWNSKTYKLDNEKDENGERINANKNSLRYDQEYHFFKKLHADHPDVFDSLVTKLQYFDPAFHSMTPEGFMGRLNFLQQCTRQGNTIGASDKNGHSANNLAFGRPPFCILRLGDFYYQKIVIRNINITYDPLVLDLNNEGIGVVPLIANVTISFNFIGGGDLSGPVRRLQNAMSFNYYANGRLYDNRADRIKREDTNLETMGAMGHDKIEFDKSYFHDVKMAK